MDVKLVVAKGKSAGRIVPVAGPKFFIGRAPDCQLRPNSNLVSRHHCVILVHEGGAAIRDFGSTNGTLVNGERIRGEVELDNGDRLTVGPLELEIRLAADLGAEKGPKRDILLQAAARPPTPSVDNELDISAWLDDVDGASAAKPLAETKSLDVAGAESAGYEEGPQESPAQSVRDVSEEQKEEMRRRREIPGVSKAAQARRITETPQDAASDALKKFYR